jgi:arylsulfatase A-like enzyme
LLDVRWNRGLMALLALAMGCAEAPAPMPNVVLIDVESLRADHIAHLGYEHATSRGLDAFQLDAALFAVARSSSSASAASSASLLTGLSPQRHGVSGANPRLAEEQETLAEMLRAIGFSTLALSHHFEISRSSGFAQGFDHFESPPGPIEAHPDAAVIVDWLREWIATQPAEPFFLYLHPMNPHAPYRVPRDRRALLHGRPPPRSFESGGDVERAVMSGRRPARKLMTHAMQRSLIEQYDLAVRYTLDRVGEMIELLQHGDRYDDSLVVVVGNHGEELFDHGGFGHGFTLYDEVLRVPLYVKLPGRSAARTIEAPVSILDVVPTVLDLLGLEPRTSDGRSLARLLLGEASAETERTLAARIDEPQNRAIARSLVQGRYKLIDAKRLYDLPRGSAALYDLVLDPGEEHDLAAEAPKIVDNLRAELDRIDSAAELRSGD